MLTAIYFRKARDKHSLNSNELSTFFFKQCTIFFSNYLALTKQARRFLVKNSERFSVPASMFTFLNGHLLIPRELRGSTATSVFSLCADSISTFKSMRWRVKGGAQLITLMCTCSESFAPPSKNANFLTSSDSCF